MAVLMLGNAWLKEKTQHDADNLNNWPGWVHLYINDIVPSPADLRTTYVEASFPGYAPVSLAGKMGPATKVQDGEYATQGAAFNFVRTGPSDQTVFGFYILGPDGVFLCGARFAIPYDMSIITVLPLGFTLQEWCLPIACP